MKPNLESLIPLLKENNFTVVEYRSLKNKLLQLSVYSSPIMMSYNLEVLNKFIDEDFALHPFSNEQEIIINLKNTNHGKE